MVPGDIISIKLGDIIPADARLLEGDPLKIDQARTEYIALTCISFLLVHYAKTVSGRIAKHLFLQSVLTGESLPVTKKKGEQVFSGSTCKQGEIEAVVIATGSSTFFGKTARLVDSTDVTGHFQQVLRSSLLIDKDEILDN